MGTFLRARARKSQTNVDIDWIQYCHVYCQTIHVLHVHLFVLRESKKNLNMEKWLSIEHGLMFMTAIAIFAFGIASQEYSFYWFIREAGLPMNITEICKLTQVDAIRSMLMLCLTWWLGSASDVIGRKKVLITNFAGLIVTLSINGVLMLTRQNPLFLIASGVFYDLTGGFGILLTVLFASVAANGDDDSRLYRIIIIDLALLLPSLIMTPVGMWIKKYGLDYIYDIVFAADALIILTMIVALVYYADNRVYHPDTLKMHFRKIGSSLKRVWFTPSATGAFLWVLSFSFFVRIFGSWGAGSINQLYLQSPPFSWDAELYSIYSTENGVIAFFSFVVVGFMSSCNLGHFTILYVSYLSFFVYFVLFGTVKTTHGLSFVNGICLFHSGTLSITRALMSKMVDKDLQGTLFVIPGILQSIAQSSGALTYATLYEFMRNYADSLYYMFTPFLFAIASSLLIIAHYIYVEKVPKESVNSDDDDGDQALLDSDANSESFSEYDPDATPID